MPPISAPTQQRLQTIFAKELQSDITITYFTQDASADQECTYCQETHEMLATVTALSDKLHLDVKDFAHDQQEAQHMGITRIPAFIIQGQAKGKVRFFGIPSGHDFSVLIDGIIGVSKGESRLSENTRKALAKIDQDLHIQVFVTPT